ncbi:MAG TPA: flagellar hook-length control protein FliK [Gammaproteobacteria bacterium]|nr:flagellar hook-length control protein FliK [Gammaproteobacteria bacterium]
MTDLTLLVNATDSALLNGSGVPPAGAGLTGESAPTAAPAGEGFASVLGQQWPPGNGAVDSQVPSSETTSSSAGVTPGGEPRPLPGKALPEETVLNGHIPAPLLEASLLSAASQVSPGTVGTALPAAQANPGATPTGETTLPRPGGTEGSRLPWQIAGQGQTNLVNGQGQSQQRTAADVQLQATQVLPVSGAVLDNRAPVASLPMQDASSIAATTIPTSLGRPVSAVTQQALSRAAAISGTTLGRRGEGAQSVTGGSLLHGAGITNSHMARTDAVLRMDNFTAALTAAQHTENTSEPRLSVATSLSTEQALLNPGGNLPDGALGISGEAPRPGMLTGPGASPALSLASPVGQPAWATELGQRVTWLANKELREAQLQLHPRNLGVVDVRIVYGADQQLNISFSASNPIARDALDASLPRLREMLEQQGLQLADANISQDSPTEREARHSHAQEGGARLAPLHRGADPVGSSLETGLSSPPPQWLAEGMLDAYA